MKKIYLTLIALTCLYAGSSFAQCSTASVVPYHEGFNISANNQLPACWAISNSSTCVTFNTSSNQGYAAFYYTPPGSNYFYSNAIQLNAGITYSASAFYSVLNNNNIVWTDFSILLGTSQSSTGLVTIASTNGNVVSITPTPLSNTFVVASSGVYYVAVRGISTGGGSGSPLLSWDDLSITIPCSYNTPTVTIAGSSPSLCSGDSYTATASGADTYSWSTGSALATTTALAQQNTLFSVTGTNTLTSCASTATVFLQVKQTPFVYITSNQASVCLGNGVVLTAAGAATYSWSTGSGSTAVTVTPSATTVYSVVGTGTNGCMATAYQTVGVMPLPVITYSTSSATHTVCKGEAVSFTATPQASVSHYWNVTNGPLFAGDVYSLTASTSVTINLKATDGNACSNTVTYALTVDNCTGIKKTQSSAEINVYPNPGQGHYTVETGNTDLKSLVITDIVGKIILTTETHDQQIRVDLPQIAAGVYYLKMNTAGKTATLKLIKE